MIKSLNDRVELNNSTNIPGLGLGVFQIPDEETAEVVKTAIKNGYRLIDTAPKKEQESALKKDLKKSV